jgi:hypothetical protein
MATALQTAAAEVSLAVGKALDDPR